MKELSLKNKKDEIFFIRKFDGKWNVLKKDTWMITDAFICDDIFWSNIDSFNSMVKAYKYMKDNIEKLI